MIVQIKQTSHLNFWTFWKFYLSPASSFCLFNQVIVSLKMQSLKEKKSQTISFSRVLLSIQGPTWLFNRVQVRWHFFIPTHVHLAHTYWPTDVVSSAAPHLRQTAGFFWHLVRAARDDGLTSSLWARHIAAGTEEQLMRVFRGHAVKKSAQGLVAAGTVAQARFAWRLDTRWHIFSAQPLAQVVHVAGLGRIQAPVCRRKAKIRVCKGLEREQRAVMNFVWWSAVRLNYS